jgi:hypothetical protein
VAVSPQELERARSLLWQHLATKGWERAHPTTWTDFDGYSDGLMPSTQHCDAHWLVRTHPGIVAGFAAAYGTDEVVAAYDMMSINRPVSCGSASVLQRAGQSYAHGKLNAQRLHTCVVALNVRVILTYPCIFCMDNH